MADSRRGEYATIHAAIVDDPEFQALTPDARYVWYTLKLLLGASGIDLIRAHLAALGGATGYPIDRLSDSLDGLEKGGWLVRQGDVLWLRNALRFNPQFKLANPKHAAHLKNHLEGLPRLKIVANFAAYYGIEPPFEPVETDSLSDSLSDTLCESGSGSSSGNGSRNGKETPPVGGEPEPGTALDPRGWRSTDAGSWSGANVMGAYVEYCRSKGWPDPPPSDRAKQGAAGKRLAEKNPPATIVQAMIGIGTLFPHCPPKSEPWDLFDLERKFTKACAAVMNDPKLQEAAFDEAFMRRVS